MSKPNETAVQRRWDWPYPIIARAEGIYLWDTEGKRYIDGSGGSSVVTSVGHGVKEIPAAMAKQAEDYSFYPAHVFSNAKLLELADLLADLARREGFKVLVASRGAEALSLAAEYRPNAISLDVFLPDMLGWTVLSNLPWTFRSQAISTARTNRSPTPVLSTRPPAG